jgi:hypothetical protein
MIPAWISAGVLPPILPGQAGHSPERSPYAASMVDLVDRFGLSDDRLKILRGFLAYRAALHAIGLTSGFQWVNGSFTENIEELEQRSPKDTDVVTFFHLPNEITQVTLVQSNPELFDNKRIKDIYSVDAYTFVLGLPTSKLQIKQVSYWYSMWSHRRDGLWKGFLQVDLAPNGDEAALQLIAAKQTGASNDE